MKSIRFLSGLMCFALLLTGVYSCKKDAERSRLTVYLTDAPATYDEVNLEIVGLQVKASADAGDNGWQSLPLPSSPMMVNLLEFTNGLDLLLSSVELPVGKVSQLRLKLGSNNYVVVDGVTEQLPLVVPSGEESGLKFNIHADLLPDIEYKLWIDFDASLSIVENGTGGHILKPVIRTFSEATGGSIKGIVMPLDADPTITATNGTDVMGAIPDDITGEFLIRGVAAGNWTITVHDNSGTYADKVINNINVTVGAVTDIGTVDL